MLRIYKGCLTVLTVLFIAGCTPGPLSPVWRITAETPIATSGLHGIETSRATLSLLPAGEIPVPEAARACGHSMTSLRSVGALRPGVGARLRMTFWTSGEVAGEQPNATEMPSGPRFDLALRLVAPDGGLAPEEEALLNTFLVTNKLSWTSAQIEAGRTIDRHRARLWNALVRSLCVEFLRSGVQRNVLSVKADLAALCRAIPASDVSGRRTFAAAFLGTEAGRCTPRRSARGSIIGADPTEQDNAAAEVTAGSADPLTESGFYAAGALPSVAALGDVTLNAIRFGDPLTQGWTLAEWEASGICRIEGGLVLPRISWMRIGSGEVIVVDDPALATHRVARRLNGRLEAGLVEQPGATPGLFSPISIPRSDLRVLTLADVTALGWQLPGEARQVQPSACML